MMTGYLQDARQRFTEFGGFELLELEAAPGPVAMWADSLLVRREEGLSTLVLLLPFPQEGALRSVRDGLAEMARTEAEARRSEGLGLMVVVLDRPLTRDEYQRWQGLTLQQGSIRVVTWVADLRRGRLFPHDGPPFGIDPDLAMLAAPEPIPEPAPPAGLQRDEPRPLGTIGLLAAMVGVWVLMTLLGRSLTATEEYDVLAGWGAVIRPELFLTGEYWRFLTAAFLHIGLVHLTLNAVSLWWVGRAVEAFFGTWRMLYIFLVAAVAGSALSAALGPPVVVSAGASGGLFGLLGAVIWYRLASPLGDRIAWRPLLTTLGVNLAMGLALYQTIDNWNHVGGLLGGTLAAAAAGVPAIQGLPAPRFRLPRFLQAAVAAGLLIAVGSLMTGDVPVPGPGRDVARAITALEDGRSDVAQPLLEKAVRRQPDQPRLHYLLIWTYHDLGRCSEAEAELNRFLALVPDYTQGAELRALVRTCAAPDA